MLPYEEMFLKICTDCFFILNELQQHIWTPWSGSPIQKWSYDDLFLCQHNCTDARFGVPKSLMLMLKAQAFWVFMLSDRLLIPCVSKEHMAFILKDQGILLEFLDPYTWRCYIPLKCWKSKNLLIKLHNPGYLNPQHLYWHSTTYHWMSQQFPFCL